MTLASTSASVQWAVRSDLQIKNFVLTVNTAMSNIGPNGTIGVSVRTQSNGDAYWVYISPSAGYIFYKYIGGQNIPMSKYIQKNSFVTDGNNALKVIAHEDTITLLCNGQVCGQLIDSDITGAGKVGLIANGEITGTFTNLKVDDVVVSDEGITYFQDDFTDPSLMYWKHYDTLGEFKVENGKLKARGVTDTTTSLHFSTINVSGNIMNDTLSVSAELDSSGEAFYYGILFHYSYDENGRGQGYIFAIVNNQGFTVFKLKDGADTLFYPEISIDINQTSNTLKVICGEGGKMDLYINGTKVKTITDNEFPSGGTGLMVTNNLVIDFDDFNMSGEIKIETTNVDRDMAKAVSLYVNPNPFKPLTRFSISGRGLDSRSKIKIFDIQGRVVRQFNLSEAFPSRAGLSLTWDASMLPSGIYLVRLFAGKSTVTRQVILLK
jgi:hypothetical protein